MLHISLWLYRTETAIRAGLAVLLLVPLFLSCQLSQNTKVEETISFDKVYDSLARFDSVVIIFNDPQGHFLDTVFHGKVDAPDQIRNLAVDGWDGRTAQIVIIGYMNGTVAYKQEKHFNGTTNQADKTILIVTPGTTLSSSIRDLLLFEGDTLAFPTVDVQPAALADKSLLWSSSAPDIVQVKDGNLKGLRRGSADVTAALRAEQGHTLKFQATVIPNPKVPEFLTHAPDTLRIAAGGAPGKITVKATPSSADNAVIWRVPNGTIMTVAPDGSVQGLQKGAIWAYATSVRNPSIVDSILIEVSDSVAVERVRFLKNPLTLFVDGAPESLMVEITPIVANPDVDYSQPSPGIVALQNGKVSGIANGTASIIASSKSSPSIQDTLRITVLTGNPVSSISIKPKPAGLAYTGGDPIALSATVMPSTAPQQVRWRSATQAIASVNDSGFVHGKAPGVARIFAISVVDSSKKDSVDIQVKRDMPQLNVGGDTTISVGQTLVVYPTVKEESGKLMVFKWDLNGDGAWDDSSSSVKILSQKYDKEKETETRFYVRDNQGNDTLVYKKVKAVLGPVILIVSPSNNSSTRVTPIKVAWTVNGQPQDTLPLEALHEGANTLTRKAKDDAGTEFSATITVYYDTIPPGKPSLHGPAIVNSTLPTWTWTSAGNGAGVFRLGLDAETFTGAETGDTLFIPAVDLKEGSHTLFVQERDAAGNWSPSGRLTIRIDQTPPAAPAVRILTLATTNVRRPKFAWATGGGGGAYQYRLDNADLTSGTVSTSDTSFVPATDLSHGPHTLYVRESDSAGNWSKAGSASVVIDTIPPATPTVSVAPASPTNNTRPTWSWASGGGGIGVYRYKLDDQNLNTGATPVTGTSFQPTAANPLIEGTHTLYVQELDSAGNWSPTAGAKSIVIDLTGPSKPAINQNAPFSPVNSLHPTMIWTSGGGGSGTYRWKWDSNDLTTDATTTSGTSAALTSNLIEGLHTFYLQELDDAGNPSPTSSRSVYCMTTGQVGGIVSSTAGSITNTVIGPTGSLYVYNGVDDVMGFNGSSWQSITQGSDLLNRSTSATLLINPQSGQPNIGYGVEDPSPEIHILTYPGSGSTWEKLWPLIGNGSFYPAFAMGNQGQPIMAVYSNNDSVVRISRYSISVKWQSAFPDIKVDWYSYGDGRLTFAMDTVNNVPYFHLRSGYQTGKFIAMTYSGGSWKTLDTSGLAEVRPHQLKIMTSPSGVLHLVQAEVDGGSYKIVLYKYNSANSVWNRVGAGAVVRGVEGQQPAVAFNSNGNPVVALNNGSVVEVYGLVGTTWLKMGNAGGVGTPISLAVGPNDIIYATSGSANLVTYKVGFNP